MADLVADLAAGLTVDRDTRFGEQRLRPLSKLLRRRLPAPVPNSSPRPPVRRAPTRR
ncbi:hypothetical protein [Streptomyces sp. YU58]|uniref:hypothetical protein n=1 Tax=Streptomyces sp. SX92 TaxID=3158972 RepID=UPI0027B97FFE|nr:hypothetical protein [Streptomyces coralus]WLW58795.1 hypothetical protein QU709_28565 [Streptomyces coralus]